MASTATKIGPKFQVTLPKRVREAAGFSVGDFVEATSVKGGILLRPKVLVDRAIEAELEAAMADVKAGRVGKSFKSARALVRDAVRRGRERAKHR